MTRVSANQAISVVALQPYSHAGFSHFCHVSNHRCKKNLQKQANQLTLREKKIRPLQ